MSLRSVLRNGFWILVAFALVFHAVAGWYYSGVIIEDFFQVREGLTPTASDEYRSEEVTFEAELGAFGALYLPGVRTTWIIHVHDLDMELAGEETLLSALQTAGYPQLAITYRNDPGQPTDPSGYYRYGFTEHDEVASAVSYARAQGAEAVVLSGFGGGGSHVLSYMRRNNIEAFRGALLDSPIANVSDIVDSDITSRRIPLVPVSMPVSVSALAKVFVSLRIDVNWSAIDYVEGAGSPSVPILIHHGTADAVVPVESSVAFAQSAPSQVTLIRVEGAGYLGSFDADRETYLEEILSFLSRVG